jgi:hypothetical protein
MFGRGQGGYWSGALKDQAQLPSNDGGEAGFLQAFGPGASPNPALDAIDVTINGGRRMPPMPRMRPAFAGIAPQGAGSPPQVPGAITFKKGDTVSKLAKQRRSPTSSASPTPTRSERARRCSGRRLRCRCLAARWLSRGDQSRPYRARRAPCSARRQA